MANGPAGHRLGAILPRATTPTTLVVADAAQTQTAAVAGALTQHQVLTGVANSSQTQTAATVTLGVAGSLVVADSSQTQTAATLALGAGLPGKVTGLTATPGPGSGQVSLSWSAPAGTPTDYVIEYKLATSPPASVSGRKFLDAKGNAVTSRDLAMWCWPQTATVAQFETALDDIMANSGGWNAALLTPFGMNPTAYGGSWDMWGDVLGNQYLTGSPKITIGAAWDATFLPMMEACYQRGLFPLVSMYTGYNNTQGWGAELVALGTTNARTLGNRIAQKLAGKRFFWHYGGDYSFNWGTAPAAVVDALFRGIRDGEAAVGDAPRPIVAEPFQERSVYDQFISQAQPGVGSTGYGWMIPSANGWYHYGSDTTVAAETCWAEASLPTSNVEPYYRNAGWSGGAPSSQQLREEVYASIIEGAVWVNYGDRDIIFGPATSSTLAGDGDPWPDLTSNDLKYAGWGFARMAEFATDLTYAPSAFIVSGEGTTTVKAAGGNSDTAGLAYFPNSRASIAVNTSLLTGTGNVRLRWYDPTNDTYTSIATSEAQNASRAVTHPGNNSAGDGDWLLVVDLVGSSHPAIDTWHTFSDGTSTATTTVVTGLTAAALYDFRVSAVNGSGTGTPSDVTQAAAPVSVADSSQTQTAATVALTQHQVLAGVAGSSQGQTAATVALTQHYGALTVAGSSQTQTADVAGALTQHQVLAVAAGAQTQTADTLALTQHQVLAGLGAGAQTQTAATVVLGVAGTLSVADSSQGQTAATVALTQHQVLAGVVGSTQGQTAATVVLGVAGVLVVADSSQTQTAAATTALTQHFVLTGVAGSVQAQASAVVGALIQHYLLAVAASLQTQRAEMIDWAAATADPSPQRVTIAQRTRVIIDL